METTSNQSNFNVDYIVTLYDFDKTTKIFELDIDSSIDVHNIDLSNDILKIACETKLLPLNISFYKIYKFDDLKYYLDFTSK
jgi:hypothetical protein